MSVTRFTIKNSTTVFVTLVLILIMGLSAYLAMPRESAPDIPIPVVIVSSTYVGVSPADMESLVTNPLEKKLKGLANIEKITSTSGDSYSVVVIEFNANIDVEDAVRKVKDKVDQAKKDLPTDVKGPDVIEINLSDIPFMVLNISGEYGSIKLKEVSKRIKDQLEPIKGVLNVTLAGGLEREIQVIPDSKKLSKYNISLDRLSKIVSAENMNIPGGVMDIGNSKYVIRIPTEFKAAKEIESLVVSNPGQMPVYVRDIAQVVDGYKDRSSYSRMNFTESVSLSIQKRSGENVIQIVEKVKKRLKELEPTLPATTKIHFTVDESKEIQTMVDELENSIILGLIFVCLVLFMFLGITNSMFISIAVPLSMLIGFIILHFMGVTLNMVVLFSLILALGMLVDDSIVVVENIYRFLEKGYNRVDAAIEGTKEVAWPVFGSTLTTIAAFIPLLFIPGVAGKFMWYLPVGVITTISASFFVAIFVNPVIAANFMRLSSKHRKQERIGTKKINRFMIFYENLLKAAVHYRKTTLLLACLTFVISIVVFALTSAGVEFFPATTPDKVYLDITMPASYTLDGTNAVASIIETRIKNHPNIKSLSTTAGAASSGGLFSTGAENPNKGRIIVEFQDVRERTENPVKTIEWMRKTVKDIPGLEVDIKEASMGPSSGAPISVQISGPDYARLEGYANQIKEMISKMDGIVDITDDYVRAKPEVLIKVNREKANILGINSLSLSSTVRTAIQGSKVSSFRDGIDEYDITVRFPQPERNSLQRIEEIMLTTIQGQQVPLVEVADVQTSGGIGAIKHQNSNRVVTVEAKPAKGFYASERLKAIGVQLKSFPLEDGYTVRFAGENEKREEMGNYLQKAFLIALMLILMVLVIEFNSVILPLIIMSSIILSLIGILFGLAIFHKPFGIIMTGVGIISLAGVIVRNGIILIQYIRQLREEGMEKYEAVILAGKTRLRPVLLTAGTAVLGLVPMTFGINFNFKYFFANLFHQNLITTISHAVEIGSQSAQFWGSMGSAMSIGLTVGTILTLIVVPALYISLDNLSERIRNAIKRH